MKELRDSFRASIALGPQLQSGGEGSVHPVVGRPSLVAKVFHRMPPDRTLQKLVEMVRLRNSELESVAAWPIDVLRDSSGVIRGFLMPRVDGNIVDSVMHPGMQRVHYPAVTYGFLVQVAVNVMEAAAVLHRAGIVIGDINERNIIVLPDATARFIDTDSFQISMAGGIGLCTVGTSTYTPVEMQGKDFAATPRTTNHDLFGLAVLLFHLLMLGRHPFAGVPRDSSFSGSIEDAIRLGAFAYAESRQTPLSPPPNTLPIRALGPLAPLFERAFMDPVRPTVSEWLVGLRELKSKLRPCSASPRHALVAGTGPCAFCRLKHDPLSAAVGAATENTPRTIDALLRRVGALDGPPDLMALVHEPAPPSIETVPVHPSTLSLEEGRAVAADARSLRPLVAVTLGAGLAATFLFVSGSIFGLLFAMMAGYTGLSAARECRMRWLRGKLGAKVEPFLSQRKSFAEDLRKHQVLEGEAIALEQSISARLAQIRQRLESEAENLRTLSPHPSAPAQIAQTAFERRWREKQLERYFIAHARIPGIGPERLATLRSFGIESAADLNEEAVMRLPGFGGLLAERLMAWRRGIEEEIAALTAPGTPDSVVQKCSSLHAAALRDAERAVRSALDHYECERTSSREELRVVAARLNSERSRLSAMALWLAQ
jgi:DNA-binding helix-hairpin-helix protein with protein kinase domain